MFRRWDRVIPEETTPNTVIIWASLNFNLSLVCSFKFNYKWWKWGLTTGTVNTHIYIWTQLHHAFRTVAAFPEHTFQSTKCTGCVYKFEVKPVKASNRMSPWYNFIITPPPKKKPNIVELLCVRRHFTLNHMLVESEVRKLYRLWAPRRRILHTKDRNACNRYK